MGASICLIVWLASIFAAFVFEDDRGAAAWIGIACGVSFIATLGCSVTCLSAALLGRFKSREPEV
jgi:hypothetical protein